MAAAVKIARLDRTATDLRGIAAKCNDGAQVRRLLALALILDGQSREEAARRAGMDRQTLRDWIHRYNAEVISGLRSIRSGGHPASLTGEQMAILNALTIEGPDLEKHKVVRWRCVDLRDEVARRFEIAVSERTIGRWLRGLGMTRLQPRPFHPNVRPGFGHLRSHGRGLPNGLEVPDRRPRSHRIDRQPGLGIGPVLCSSRHHGGIVPDAPGSHPQGRR